MSGLTQVRWRSMPRHTSGPGDLPSEVDDPSVFTAEPELSIVEDDVTAHLTLVGNLFDRYGEPFCIEVTVQFDPPVRFMDASDET